MSEKSNYLSYSGLVKYHDLITAKIDAADAKAIKTVALSSDGSKLLLYKTATPQSDTAADYEISFPEADLTDYVRKLTGATNDDIATLNADGTYKDSGKKLSDFDAAGSANAVKTELEAKINSNKGEIDAINNASTGILASAKTYTDNQVSGKANKDDVYTKEEVDGKVSGLWHFKGTIATDADLPKSGMKEGDVYQVTSNNKEMAYDGSKWVELGSIVDLSSYYTSSQVDNAIETAKAAAISAAASDATSKANTAKNEAITAAASDVDGKLGVLGGKTVKAYVDEAKDSAIATAASDAATKASGALESAKAYADNLGAGYEPKGESAKALASAKTYADNADTTLSTTLKGEMDSKINTKVGEIGTNTVKQYVDSAKSSVSGEVTALKNGAVATNKANIDNLESRISGIETVTGSMEKITDEEITKLFE